MLKNIEIYLYNYIVGQESFDPESFRQAVRYYQEFLIKNRNNPTGYGNLGFCYFYLKDYKRAIESYQKAVQYNPNYYTYNWDVGMIYFYLKNYEKATAYLQKAVDQIPPTIAYYVKLGEKLQSRGKTEKEQLPYVFIQQAEDDENRAYELLIQCYLYVKEYSVMREIAVLGLRSHPTNQKLLYYAGLANVMMKKYNAAILYFDQLLALNPDYLQAYYYRGVCFEKTNRHDEARKNWAKVAGQDFPPEFEALSMNKINLHLNSGIQALEIQTK